jgi:hypothetical protein
MHRDNGLPVRGHGAPMDNPKGFSGIVRHFDRQIAEAPGSG